MESEHGFFSLLLASRAIYLLAAEICSSSSKFSFSPSRAWAKRAQTSFFRLKKKELPVEKRIKKNNPSSRYGFTPLAALRKKFSRNLWSRGGEKGKRRNKKWVFTQHVSRFRAQPSSSIRAPYRYKIKKATWQAEKQREYVVPLLGGGGGGNLHLENILFFILTKKGAFFRVSEWFLSAPPQLIW